MIDMTTDEWKKKIDDWRESFELTTRPPIEFSEQTSNLFSGLPSDFVSLYGAANGLRSDWFNILPIHSPDDVKNTWDSLNRANDPSTTRFFGGDDDLMKRFFIFAEIGGGCCASCDRNDGTIWYEDDEGIHQAEFDLKEFIGTTLREVAEL